MMPLPFETVYMWGADNRFFVFLPLEPRDLGISLYCLLLYHRI